MKGHQATTSAQTRDFVTTTVSMSKVRTIRVSHDMAQPAETASASRVEQATHISFDTLRS